MIDNARKKQAISLRKQGYSYSEISSQLRIAKSTCSLWLRSIKPSNAGSARLARIKKRAIKRGQGTTKKKIKERDVEIATKAKDMLAHANLNGRYGKIVCAALHWAEGEKRSKVLSFTNSDPNMIKVYLDLLRKNFNTVPEKFRAILHLHQYHDEKKQVSFWSKVTKIPVSRISVYKKPNTSKNKRPGYPGCISIRYGDIRLAREMEFIYTSLRDYTGV